MVKHTIGLKAVLPAPVALVRPEPGAAILSNTAFIRSTAAVETLAASRFVDIPLD